MRDLTLGTLGFHSRASTNDTLQRLSSSCPSLCPSECELTPRPGNHDTRISNPDLLLATCSTNGSPTHLPSTSHAQQIAEQSTEQSIEQSVEQSVEQSIEQSIDRRRSWTGDLEDLQNSRRDRRSSGENHLLQAQNMVNIISLVKVRYINRFDFDQFEFYITDFSIA